MLFTYLLVHTATVPNRYRESLISYPYPMEKNPLEKISPIVKSTLEISRKQFKSLSSLRNKTIMWLIKENTIIFIALRRPSNLPTF